MGGVWGGCGGVCVCGGGVGGCVWGGVGGGCVCVGGGCRWCVWLECVCVGWVRGVWVGRV